jgi:prolyl-tRNA synthetase
VLKAAHKIVGDLTKEGIRVHLDDRTEYSPGWKFNEWEMKGIPLRIEIGPKDLEKNDCVVKRRDIAGYGKGGILTVNLVSLRKEIPKQLDALQHALFETAKKHLDSHTVHAKNWDEFVAAIKEKKWVKVYFYEDEALELAIKEKTAGVTSRCIPLGSTVPEGAPCFYSGKQATAEVIFARNY